MYGIASSGTAVDRRALWERLDDLRAAVEDQSGLSLADAVSQYVEVVSGQHGQRLDVLLAVTGLNGQDPIIGPEAARRLNVSSQRIYQIVDQLHRRMNKARPAKGAWLPQIAVADGTHWPMERTGRSDTPKEVSTRFGVRSRTTRPRPRSVSRSSGQVERANLPVEICRFMESRMG